MPYLFQSGHYHPGKYTLETTRSGAAPMAALANLLLFGKDGLRSLLGHLVTMAESLRDHLNGHPATTVLNRESFGLVTLFRVYPDGVDMFIVPQCANKRIPITARPCENTTITTAESSSWFRQTRWRGRGWSFP